MHRPLRQIAEARAILARPGDHRPSLVALASRVLKQWSPR